MRKLIFLIVCLLVGASSFAIDTENTRMLTQPAVSANHVAFIYGEDLWIADKDGSHPRRLTVYEGVESNPVFSPDGSMIAFTGQYDGNLDVYVVPSSGGIPKRLTWHPSADQVRDFTPDGKQVLFTSQRNVFTNRYSQLFTVNLSSGTETPLPLPNANWAVYNADGTKLAYTPNREVFTVWKNYRGGTESRIWIYDTKTHAVEEVPKPQGGANDARPLWIGNKVYFRSDRDGEFNLYSYDVGSKKVERHTNFTNFPITTLGAGKTDVIYEQAGYLHLFTPGSNTSKQLKIGIATDLLDLRPQFLSGDSYIRSADISPGGNRVVLDYRGDIVTIPAQKGDMAYITNTPGVHERSPAWSPDGRTIAYFSDESGEYALHLAPNGTSQEIKKFPVAGTGFYHHTQWSPDSKHITFVDNGRNLYIYTVAANKLTKVAQDKNYVPGDFRNMGANWSSDASHLAYTVITETNYERAYIYSLATGRSTPVSDGLSNVTDPVFDPSGKYLYMLASTNAGPVVNWFDQSNNDMRSTNALYVVTLQKTVPSPFLKENDIEEVKDTSKAADSLKTVTQAMSKVPLRIDWDRLENRMLSFPISSGNYRNLAVPKEGEVYFIASNDGDNMLHSFTLKKRKDEALMPADGFLISANGTKMLYASRGKWGITNTGQKPTPESLLNTSGIQVKTDPQAEWKNIFNEAWRVNRDYFYDANMHGLNWNAIKNKYSVFLPDLSSRSDLYRVLTWMFSELGVGHLYISPGDQRVNVKTVPGGLLGADYEVSNNRYRIKKIYGGLNWTPSLRSPLTEPGVNAEAGDYIIAVNGQNVNATDNLYSFFENTSGKITSLTLSRNADGSSSRTVKVVPIASEGALRNRDWVEGNIRKVDAATNGQVAYVHVPNTAELGHEYFKRYFFPQANKKAIIIDERFNGGGQLADYYIDILKRPAQSYWKYRYGNDLKAPLASIQGPKVMLVDENAGSGGDYLPYLFRQAKLGTIVGKRTWGGLVGILGYPEFIDGGSVTAPNVAFYNEDGYGIENVGTPPDVEVEQWPKDVIAGQDPQLQKAIEIIMKQLKENPPKELKAPAPPQKMKR